MTDATPLIDYATLRDSLAHAGAIVALPELHGGICGALCAGGASAAERWLEQCLLDQDLQTDDDVQAPLHDVVSSSWRMLGGDDLSFEPLLPDDDAPLDEQVQALGLWCHGFLGGLGATAPDVGGGARLAGGAHGDASSAAAIDEILGDFAEISKAGLSEDDEADRDQADFALAELKEYVRVSVQIMFEELAARREAAARDVH